MIRRRFVNLVAENKSTGVLSLHRLDVAKNLFYPSTAKAEAANAANENNNGGGGKPPRIGSLRRLPQPSLFFERLSGAWEQGRWRRENDMFVLLSPHSSEGKILQAGGGHAILHDVDSGSTAIMPGIDQPSGYTTIFFINSIAGSGTGAGTGKEGEGSLYVMTNHYWDSRLQPSFQVLDLSQHPHKWQPLPLPPFAESSGIRSFTVVDGGRTICTSTDRDGTYCFDTRSHEWWKAGDWALPFDGRVEHVPELETWLGFCPKLYQFGHSCHSNQLCASGDLSAMDAHRAPTLQQVWEDLNTPKEEEEEIELKRKGFRGIVLSRRKEWWLQSCDLINLGGGRFCIAKFFRVENRIIFYLEHEPMDTCELVVLSGVEVVRGGDDDEGGLRIVKHKSKHYMFDSDRTKWVL